MFFPTYRRIEKDLREISPKLRRKFREDLSSDGELELTRSSRYYVDLVSFGMNDVRNRLNGLASELRDFSLSKFNELSGLYLKDVIRGQADDFNVEQIRDLSESALSKILGRVSEDVLSDNDKTLLRQKVTSIRSNPLDSISVHDRFLAHYFSRLVVVNEEISQKEGDILSFVETCNDYLHPRKQIVYDETTFSTAIYDQVSGPIDLSLLSSGEKQVISVFAHLFLDKQEVQTVIIDEPELSLSVPWQKRFLEDILKSNRCSFLLSVTHSPFVYQNSLRQHALDLRKNMY
ncbi:MULTISPECIES: AAA family ATPase [unclassified Phaeobacter]|uniref:AAA family ATPase n=1 Tax=unclassified Phaeobacter TaxID=2621772 RepID=UPI003A8B392E